MVTSLEHDRSVREYLSGLEAGSLRESNGRAQLEQAAREYESLRQQDIAAVRAELLQESEEWGGYVDRREASRFYEDSVGMSVEEVNPDDQYQGRMVPIYRDERDLRIIWSVGRYLARENPQGVSIMGTLTDYTIGTGYTYTITPKQAKRKNAKPEESDPQAEAIAAFAQEIIDCWQEEVGWTGDMERELSDDACENGEFLLRLKPRLGGLPLPELIANEWVTQPSTTDWMSDDHSGLDWTFGVGTDVNRSESVRAYFIQYAGQATDWEIVPACEMIHGKFNVKRRQKRGLSDYFSARILKATQKLIDRTIDGATGQASIAYIREYPPGVSEDQIGNVRLGLKTSQGTQSTSTGPRTVYGQKIDRSKILDVSNGLQFKYGPLGQLGGPVFMEIATTAVRLAGNRWRLPGFMSMSDASETAYASAMVAGSPFVRSIEHRQSRFVEAFRKVMWRVLGAACLRGDFLRKFNIANLRELKQVITLDITTPAVAVGEDVEKRARSNQIKFQCGVLSARTWAEEDDLDYDNEVASGAKATEAAPSPFDVQSGQRPPMPFGPQRQPPAEPKPVKESREWWQCGKGI